ncbi:hypothetical protein [Turneriella parva]|uniref:Transcriptional regulator n=1 Tax=Turneriella parva (strain ATCC BAA-1111 / DSM 21527 / NCTC 11395 / H) TaxID=869212 RepID=I4B7Y4_TURPD|nr:hypothetical protein [Turneriella parva]AFM13391.1 hypothetical protein Turpa_2752 [Turneriella parva DSM 21527]
MGLITDTELAAAKKKPDDLWFRQGVQGIISRAIAGSWAEPLMLARRAFGEATEQPFESIARLTGSLAGKVLRPFFTLARSEGEHRLEDTLKATRLAENMTGIYGDDFYINDKRVVRRVHTCPFRSREGATIICHVGEAAGQELFKELVPGTRHKVHVTMARGHAHCEYSYEID